MEDGTVSDMLDFGSFGRQMCLCKVSLRNWLTSVWLVLKLSPHGPESPCMVLLVQLLRDLPRFKVKGPQAKSPASDLKGNPNAMYENGLSDKEIEMIAATMFGPGSLENSPRKQRLLKSTIELGFPKAGRLASSPSPPLVDFVPNFGGMA